MRAKKKKPLLSLLKSDSEVVIGTNGEGDITLGTKHACVTATDIYVDGVHFDLTNMTPAEVGYRSLAASLARTCAQGDIPIAAQLRLGLPQSSSDAVIDGFLDGYANLARKCSIRATYTEPSMNPSGVLITLTLFSRRKKLRAVGPKLQPGDRLVLTRPPGIAAAGLHGLRKVGRSAYVHFPMLAEAYLKPTIEAELALKLRDKALTSAMRTMRDGLVSELHGLMGERYGVRIDQTQLPITPESTRAAQLYQGNAELWALYGSEDFSLLMAVSPGKYAKAEKIAKALGSDWYELGEVIPEPGIEFKRADGEVTRLADRQWHLLARRRRY